MRRPMMHSRLPLLVAVFALCSACASRAPLAPAAAGGGLDDTAWVLTSLGGQPPLAHVPVNLRFGADGAVSGSDGCNVLRGAFVAGAASLQIGDKLASTMMACTAPVNEQAKRYLELLLQVRRYAIDGSYLTLSDDSGRSLLTFQSRQSTLPGSSWEVLACNNGRGGVASLVAGTRIDVHFGTNGRVNGSAGCNAFVADFDTEQNKVSIGMSRTTRKACAEPAGVMEQEAQFLRALHSAATFRVDGDRLELRTADGATALQLKRTVPPAEEP